MNAKGSLLCGAMFTALLALIACSPGKIMTMSDFQSIPLGENIATLQVREGRPYQVNDVGDGTEEYVYMERVDIGAGRELFREYVFVVSKDNAIVEKKIRETSSPNVLMKFDN